MKKLKNVTKFQIGFLTSAIWSTFFNHREMFGLSTFYNYLITLGIGLILYFIGVFVANKICEK
jgi:hypothetical protein